MPEFSPSGTIYVIEDTRAPIPIHVEILLRLVDLDGAVIPPMAFILAAERYGVMSDIDRWLIHHALNYIAQLATPEDALFSTNLSGSSLKVV